MSVPLVRGSHTEPLQSNEFSEALTRSGYGAIHELLGQPNITGAQALSQINYGGKISERTLVEIYSGRNLLLANKVELELRNTDSVLFRICPLQKTDHLGKRVMYRTRYKQSVLGPLATFGLVRHMVHQRSSHAFELSGFGIGFQFELQSLLNEEGRDIFNNYVQMAASNTVLTAEICAIEAIIGCHETDKALDKFFPQTVGTLTDLVDAWNNNAFAIHKKGNGIQLVVGWIKKARALLKVAAAEALLVPQNTAEQLAFGNPEARDVSRAGNEAIRVRANGASEYTSVGGLRMVELPPEPINDTGAGLYDALKHAVEFGSFYVSDNNATMSRAHERPYDTSDERSIAIFTMENNGNRKVIKPETMVQNDLAFDAASGMLNEPVLSELAQNYETMCRAKQMSLHPSPNGDPLVDPNIAFDENQSPFVVRHFGDIDPAYMSESFIKTLARINQQELKRTLGDQAMQDIRNMLGVLDEAANYGISASRDEASQLEAMAAAIALHRPNRKTLNKTANDRATLTDGNLYGADVLPPLTGARAFQFADANGTLTPLAFNQGVYGVFANNVNPSNPTITAPNYPPGCSSANWAAYISAAMSNGDPTIASWTYNAPEALNKFATVARGWRAFERYFDEQRGVFSLSKEKGAENVLFSAESCPVYMRPNNRNEMLAAKIAYFQQVFVGYRGPLAVGLISYTNNTITVANTALPTPPATYQSTGAAAFDSLSYVDVGLMSRNQGRSDASQQRTRGGVQVNLQGTGTIVNATQDLINVLTTPPSILNPGLVDALTLNKAAAFDAMLQKAFDAADAGRSPLPIPTGYAATMSPIVRLVHTPLAALGGSSGTPRTLLEIAASGNEKKAAPFLNALYDSLTKSPNMALNEKNMSIIVNRTLATLTSVEGVETMRGLHDFDQSITDATGAPGSYLVTRLQVASRGSNGIFGHVTAERAYNCILRPVSYQAVGRVVAPHHLNNATTVPTYPIAAAIKTKGRADSYVDRSRGSLSTSNIYSDGVAPMYGPMSFYVEQNHGGAGAGVGQSAYEQDFGGSSYYPSGGALGMKRAGGASSDSGYSGMFDASKRVMGGSGGVYTSAGVHHDQRYAPSEGSMYNIATRDADDGSAIGDLVLHTPVRVNSTRWLTTRLNIVERMLSDPLERAMAITFLLTPVHRDLLMHMVQRNYVLPRSYLLVQPFIRLAVYAAYAVSYGIGQTLYAYPNISIGSDANTLLCTARFSTKLGAAILSPEQVTPIPLFKFGDYLGGASTTPVAPGTVFNEMQANSHGSMHHYSYSPQDYANRHADLFIIGTGCDSTSFGDELPLGGYFRPTNITSRLSEQDSANMLRQRYPSALYFNLLCGFDTIGNQQLGVPNSNDNYHLLTDMVAPMSETYAGRLCFQGPQNNYNPVTGAFDRIYSAGTGPLGPLAPNCGNVIKGDVGMTTFSESQRLISTPLAIAY